MRHELGLLKSTGMKRELLNIYSCLSETEFQEEILQLGSISSWRILDIRKFSLSNSKLRYADVLMYNLAAGLYVFVELESADHNEEHVVNQMLSLSNLIANEGELRTRLAEYLDLQGEDAHVKATRIRLASHLERAQVEKRDHPEDLDRQDLHC